MLEARKRLRQYKFLIHLVKSPTGKAQGISTLKKCNALTAQSAVRLAGVGGITSAVKRRSERLKVVC